MGEEVKIKKVYFYNSKNQKLVGILHEKNKDKIVIICHGITGCKNHNFTPLLSNFLEKNNFSVLRFDFTGNGNSEGEINEGNYSQELDDLGKVIDFVKKLGYNKIGVIGHSMGGAVALLRTAIDKRINYLISIASTAYPNKMIERIYPHQKKELKERGWILWWDHWKLEKSFFDDTLKYDCTKYIKKIKKPLLIIHGDKDDTIPLQQAKDLYKNANEPKYLEVIKEADHCFGYEGLYKNQEETKEYKIMKQKILQFLKKHLK